MIEEIMALLNERDRDRVEAYALSLAVRSLPREYREKFLEYGRMQVRLSELERSLH